MEHKVRWFDPQYKKTSRATELLARVAQLLRACAPQWEKTPRWEAHTQQLERSPCSLQLDKALVQQRRPTTTKKQDK